MCVDPFTMAAIAATAVSAAGQIAAGNAANAAGKANERALIQQGKSELNAANMSAADIHAAGRRHAGEIAAIQGANGVALDSGSAADVGAADALAFETDALRAIYGGRVRDWQARTEGAIKRAEGKAAQRQGYIMAGATLLGGAAKLGGAFGGASTPASPGSYLDAGSPSIASTGRAYG